MPCPNHKACKVFVYQDEISPKAIRKWCLSEDGKKLLGQYWLVTTSDYDTLLQYYLTFAIDLPAQVNHSFCLRSDGCARLDLGWMLYCDGVYSVVVHNVSKQDISGRVVCNGALSVGDVEKWYQSPQRGCLWVVRALLKKVVETNYWRWVWK